MIGIFLWETECIFLFDNTFFGFKKNRIRMAAMGSS